MLNLSRQNWASVVVVWLVLVYVAASSLGATGTVVAAVVLLPVIALVQAGVVGVSNRMRARLG